MSKTKTPFFSIGAQGSVGRSITAQKLRGETLIRGKPCPTDPYSLPQAYRRWLYQDYAYLWTKQDEATRRLYATYGSVYHLTAFQYWMKYHLKVMPDIVGWWRLDEGAGAVAYDQATDPHNGVIVGASPSGGVINRARFFDGLNDYIIVNPPPTVSLTACTFLCFMLTPAFDAIWRMAFSWGYTAAPFGPYMAAHPTTNTIYVQLRNTAGVAQSSGVAYTPNAWEMRGCVWDGTTMWHVRNDTLSNPLPFAGIVAPTAPLYIGKREPQVAKFWYDGYQDNFIFYNRSLDAAEIARWAGRRYPLQ